MTEDEFNQIGKWYSEPHAIVPWAANELVGKLIAELAETRTALRLALMRIDTGNEGHDHRTCGEPSCVMGRKVLGEKCP
jgi:hypothetical protein